MIIIEKEEKHMRDKMNYQDTLSNLSGLIDEYWNDYAAHRILSFVVNPSIPIIWFGNLEAYCNSSVRVVTIGLNPSNGEFLDSNKTKKKKDETASYSPSFRFYKAKDLVAKSKLLKVDKDKLIESYNDYFNPNNSYDWFSNFETVFGYFPDDVIKPVSYKTDADKAKSKQANAAIHIDFKTALATDPTWGELNRAYKNATSKKKEKTEQNDSEKLKDILKLPEIIRKDLFEKLLHIIAPDIILFSQAEEYLKEFTNEDDRIGEPQKIEEREDGTKYKQNEYKRMIFDADGSLLIYESYGNCGPFGLTKEKDRKEKFSNLIRDQQKIWQK